MSFNIVYKGIRKRRARWHTRSSLIGRDRIVRWRPAQYDLLGMTRFSYITSAVLVGAGGKTRRAADVLDTEMLCERKHGKVSFSCHQDTIQNHLGSKYQGVIV